MRYKVNRACRVNGTDGVFEKGQVIEEGQVPAYVISILLNLGYAEEDRARNKKNKETEAIDG